MSYLINRPLISMRFLSRLRKIIIKIDDRMRWILTISIRSRTKKSLRGIRKPMRFGLSWSCMKWTILITMISWPRTHKQKWACLPLIELNHTISRAWTKTRLIKLTLRGKCKCAKQKWWEIRKRRKIDSMLCSSKN
jgi:hypothetical protein